MSCIFFVLDVCSISAGSDAGDGSDSSDDEEEDYSENESAMA